MKSVLEKKKVNQRLEDDDLRYIWHPFTQMANWLKERPLIISEGEGNYLRDINGMRYLDGVSSIWTNLHGHKNKRIDRAIQEQISRIAHSTLLGLSNMPSIQLAGRLVEIVPEGLKRVFYSDNGSTAVEVALKMAFQYWQQKGGDYQKKKKFISLTHGYHGDTLGSVGVGGIELFHGLYRPITVPSIKAESPYCYRCPWGGIHPECGMKCLIRLKETLDKSHREIAAVILEPMVQGAGGMIVFPSGYLKDVRRLCYEYEVLLISDEVATGFGRTGRMFACEHEDVSPDIMAVGKGITGGYMSLAATITTDEVFNAFLGDYEKTFFHGHTYTGNPLACAAALASLDIFADEKVMDGLEEKIRVLGDGLKSFSGMEHVGDVRHKGMMVGIELVKDRATKEEYPYGDRLGARVCMEARRKGLIIRPLGDVVVLMPPFSITIEEIERIVDIVSHSIKFITQ